MAFAYLCLILVALIAGMAACFLYLPLIPALGAVVIGVPLVT